MRDDPPEHDDLTLLPTLLGTRWLGRVHEHHAVVESTNDRAAAWARAGAPHGALVTADAQTAGRGRRGRTWQSLPAGNLYASFVLRPGPVREDFAALSLAIGVALREAIPGGISLKWPNDLIAGGRKLGGILCESRWLGRAPEVVVGFGINVGQREFVGELAGQATSLALLGASQPRATLLAALAASLEHTLEGFFARGFVAIRARYLAACPWLGQPIRVRDTETSEHKVRVIAETIDDQGRLVVRDESGARRRLQAGELWL